jgi:hypothetical protein
LSRLAEFDEHGRQLRHDLKIAEGYVPSSLKVALSEFSELKRRLSSISDREPLFLPPKNFWITDTERIADAFGKMLRQRTRWNDTFDHIRQVKVSASDLGKNIPTGVQKTVLSDVRNLLYPHDRSQHGLARELAEDCSAFERQLFMRSWFRFGVPLGDGYHHDVQFAGRKLGGARFECARQGTLELNCSHASVYPNDYVRPSKT